MNSLRYIVVDWIHEPNSYPVRLYSEIDADGWEKRKVEEFKDGKLHFADAESSSGDTRLGEAVIPPLEEIARDSQFRPREVKKADFESVWIRAKNE
jgi:hypothetical protein